MLAFAVGRASPERTMSPCGDEPPLSAFSPCKEACPIKTLRFTYSAQFTYGEEITKHHLYLRCFPRPSESQQVKSLSVTLSPAAVLSYSTDPFRNPAASCILQEPHDQLKITVKGEVETRTDPLPSPDRMRSLIYSVQSTFTRPGSKLLAAAQSLPRKDNDFHMAEMLMHWVWKRMTYTPGATDIHTSAEAALRLGKGVCQDYSHIMIALLRHFHIPARYIVGLIPGEGVTHAWVEALCGGAWYGFDPTNNHTVTGEYIKFSHGRDYNDTIVVSGFFTGTARQGQSISAAVDEQQQ